MSKTNHNALDEATAWQADGHVADVVLDALADGELEVVPKGANEHVDGCAWCTERLGKAALLSLGLTDAMREAAAQKLALARTVPQPVAKVESKRAIDAKPPSSARRPRVPVYAIAAALGVALVAALPAAFGIAADAPGMVASMTRSLPLVAHVLFAAVFAATKGKLMSPTVTVLSWVSAVLFLGVGIKLARAASRQKLATGEGASSLAQGER